MHIYQLFVLRLVAMWLAKSKSCDYREAMLGHVKKKKKLMTLMHRQYRRPMSHDLPLNIYRKISKISPSFPPLRLLSSQNWLLEPAFLSALFTTAAL